jgi:hypothetical protein
MDDLLRQIANCPPDDRRRSNPSLNSLTSLPAVGETTFVDHLYTDLALDVIHEKWDSSTYDAPIQTANIGSNVCLIPALSVGPPQQHSHGSTTVLYDIATPIKDVNINGKFSQKTPPGFFDASESNDYETVDSNEYENKQLTTAPSNQSNAIDIGTIKSLIPSRRLTPDIQGVLSRNKTADSVYDQPLWIGNYGSHHISY